MLKRAVSFFVFTFIAELHIYLQGKNKQLRRGKSSHGNTAMKIGRNVFYVTTRSGRETVAEHFYHRNNYTKKTLEDIYGNVDS